MIAHFWKFWHVGPDIRLSHTANPATERFICTCGSSDAAELLTALLNNTIRYRSNDLVDLILGILPDDSNANL